LRGIVSKKMTTPRGFSAWRRSARRTSFLSIFVRLRRRLRGCGSRSKSERGDRPWNFHFGRSCGIPLRRFRDCMRWPSRPLWANGARRMAARRDCNRAGIATAPPAWKQGTVATAWPLTTNSAAHRINPRAALGDGHEKSAAGNPVALGWLAAGLVDAPQDSAQRAALGGPDNAPHLPG